MAIFDPIRAGTSAAGEDTYEIETDIVEKFSDLLEIEDLGYKL